MLIAVKPFKLEKQGNHSDDYEDAFELPSSVDDVLRTTTSFAVADGATEGSYSGEWARILTSTFLKAENQWDLSSQPSMWLRKRILRAAYREWTRVRRLQVRERNLRNLPIQWYEEQSAENGAFATFLGFCLAPPGRNCSGDWISVACGDTNLFQVRNESLIVSFPVSASVNFSNSPPLISSEPRRNRDIGDNTKFEEGKWQVDDQFYLMTDALSAWFLREVERGEKPWQTLRDLDIPREGAQFVDWMNGLRARKEIRNDDVTLIRIEILTGGPE